MRVVRPAKVVMMLYFWISVGRLGYVLQRYHWTLLTVFMNIFDAERSSKLPARLAEGDFLLFVRRFERFIGFEPKLYIPSHILGRYTNSFSQALTRIGSQSVQDGPC